MNAIQTGGQGRLFVRTHLFAGIPQVDEDAPGGGYTATKPSTSSIVSLAADNPVERSQRIAIPEELCDIWSGETGCSLDEIVGDINDAA